MALEDVHILIPEPVTYMVKGPYGVTKDCGMERENIPIIWVHLT